MLPAVAVLPPSAGNAGPDSRVYHTPGIHQTAHSLAPYGKPAYLLSTDCKRHDYDSSSV